MPVKVKIRYGLTIKHVELSLTKSVGRGGEVAGMVGWSVVHLILGSFKPGNDCPPSIYSLATIGNAHLAYIAWQSLAMPT